MRHCQLQRTRYNKVARKIREQEASGIYDSSKDRGNVKVPKPKGGKGVKSSSKLAPKSAPKSSGKGTPKTGGSTSAKSTPRAASKSCVKSTLKAASGSSAKPKPIHKPVYLANKGTTNPKVIAQQGKGNKSHVAIKPSASYGRRNDSESGEDKDNDINEEEDEENCSELWNKGRDDPNENIMRNLKKAVEKSKNKESSADDDDSEYESDNEEKKKCKREKRRKDEE